MNASMTIEEFSALLDSERKDSPWLEALRKLIGLEGPEKIIKIIGDKAFGTWM